MPLPLSWNAGCPIISRYLGGMASAPPTFLERRPSYNFQDLGGVASPPSAFPGTRQSCKSQVLLRGG